MKRYRLGSLRNVYVLTVVIALSFSWAGSAIVQVSNFQSYPLLFGVGVALLGFGTMGGVSVGIALIGRTVYACAGVLGRFALLGLAVGLELWLQKQSPTSPPGHPYLIAMGVMLATLWVAIDFVLLYFLGKSKE